jgi:hypothetical protein
VRLSCAAIFAFVTPLKIKQTIKFITMIERKIIDKTSGGKDSFTKAFAEKLGVLACKTLRTIKLTTVK